VLASIPLPGDTKTAISRIAVGLIERKAFPPVHDLQLRAVAKSQLLYLAAKE